MKNLDERIEAAKNGGSKKVITIPGGTPGETYEIEIAQGQTPLVQHPDPKDITLHFDPAVENQRAAEEREAMRRSREAVSEITMPDSTPTEASTVTVGNVSMQKNLAEGYERSFQKNGGEDYYVFVDGKIVRPSEALDVLFDLLKTMAKADKT